MTCTCCQPLSDDQRIAYPAALFGAAFPFGVEPAIFTFAQELSSDYTGGYWEFYALSNGGFYMAPKTDEPFKVACQNEHRIAPIAREARLHPEMAAELHELAKSWSSGELAGVPCKAWTTPGATSGLTGEQAFEKEWRRFVHTRYHGRSATLATIFHDAKLAA